MQEQENLESLRNNIWHSLTTGQTSTDRRMTHSLMVWFPIVHKSFYWLLFKENSKFFHFNQYLHHSSTVECSSHWTHWYIQKRRKRTEWKESWRSMVAWAHHSPFVQTPLPLFISRSRDGQTRNHRVRQTGGTQFALPPRVLLGTTTFTSQMAQLCVIQGLKRTSPVNLGLYKYWMELDL